MWVQTKIAGGQRPPWYSSTLWHTMSVGGWWRFLRAHRFRLAARKLPLAASITFYTINNSVLGLLQSAIYGSRVRRTCIERDPIFILGHWRSGTTHLHELLALDVNFTAPTTYECVTPRHFLLTDRLYPALLSWVVPSKRAFDNMELGFQRPQEDELALVALGVPSPMWTAGYPDDTVGQAYLTLLGVSVRERRRWEDAFTQFLRRVTYRHPGRPLLLKSPGHTARLQLLQELFPAARYLHIVRNPYQVFASTVHLWQKVIDFNGLVRPDPDRLERKVLQTLQQMYEGFDRARASLPDGCFHQLRYEDLIRDPMTTLESCYAALALGDIARVAPRVMAYLSGRRDYRPNEYEISAEGKAAVRQAWGPIFSKWGYEI